MGIGNDAKGMGKHDLAKGNGAKGMGNRDMAVKPMVCFT